MMEILNTFMRKKINIKMLFLLLFIWRLIPIFFMKGINISTDEFTIVGMAAYLSGLDWTSVIRPQYYYGYPTAFLYALIFFIKPLLNNPVLLYQLCLMINAFIGMLSTWIAYRIFLDLYGNDRSKIAVIWLTIIFSMFVSSISYEKVLTNETLFSFCFMVSLWLCVKLVNSSRKMSHFYSIVLGFVSILTYAINGRGIILFGMILGLWIIMKFFRKTYSLYIFDYILSVLVFFAIHSQIKNWSTSIFFAIDSTKIANSGAESHLQILLNFISPNGILALSIAVIGIFYALTYSSFGFSIILPVFAVSKLRKKVFHSTETKGKRQITWADHPKTCVLLILCVLFILGSIFITIMHFGNFFYDMGLELRGFETVSNFRADRMFYSRYTATIKPFLVSFGLYLMAQIDLNQQNHILLISTALTGILCLFFQFINAPLINGVSYASSNSPELSIVLSNRAADYKYGEVIASRFILASAIVIIIMVLYITLIKLKKKKWIAFMFCGLNFIFGVFLLVRFLIPRSEFYYNIPDNRIVSYLQEIQKDTSEIIFMTNEAEDYLYQMRVPKIKVSDYDVKLLEQSQEIIFSHFSDYDLTNLSDKFYQVQYGSNEWEVILIKGKETLKYFESLGFPIISYNEEY